MILKTTQTRVEHTRAEKFSRLGERSFSLVETLVAVALISFLMIEVTGVHGNAINFADYGRKSLQATYLLKRMMSQVEYHASRRTPLKDLAVNEKDHAFDDAPDFSYSLAIEPLPNAIDLMFKLMSAGLLGGDEKSDKDDDSEGGKQGLGAMLEQMKTMIQASVGEDPIWVAKASVSWAEGARRASVDSALIITDLKKLESTLSPLISKSGQGGGAVSPTATNSGVPNKIPKNEGNSNPTPNVQ